MMKLSWKRDAVLFRTCTDDPTAAAAAAAAAAATCGEQQAQPAVMHQIKQQEVDSLH
jgi:hypothetical protein